jgi:hypothetical protein
MPTSYHVFRLLPFEEQVPLVWTEGTFLARRWEEEDGMGLYHMEGGFFCEVTFELENYTILELKAFTSTAWLEHYTCYINLNDLTNPTE